jgi:hypothetical protein
MKIYIGLVFVFIILVLFTVIVYNFTKRLPTIYGIMITGKDDDRIAMAAVSCRNFFEQDYVGNKRLIIINHNSAKVGTQDKDVLQIHVDRKKNSLGAMRNIALELIPTNALWTTWDDDDYRSPDYLSKLYKCLVSKVNASASTFINRYEFNLNTNSAWRMTLKSGFVTMLCKKIPGYYYLNKDSLEDVNLKSFYAQRGSGIAVYNNKPNEVMYIRLVHNNNTSLYVVPNKVAPALALAGSNADYSESSITEHEKEHISQLMQDLVQALKHSNTQTLKINYNG